MLRTSQNWYWLVIVQEMLQPSFGQFCLSNAYLFQMFAFTRLSKRVLQNMWPSQLHQRLGWFASGIQNLRVFHVPGHNPRAEHAQRKAFQFHAAVAWIQKMSWAASWSFFLGLPRTLWEQLHMVAACRCQRPLRWDKCESCEAWSRLRSSVPLRSHLRLSVTSHKLSIIAGSMNTNKAEKTLKNQATKLHTSTP